MSKEFTPVFRPTHEVQTHHGKGRFDYLGNRANNTTQPPNEAVIDLPFDPKNPPVAETPFKVIGGRAIALVGRIFTRK